MIVVPDEASRIKRCRFPKFLLSLSILSIILWAGLFCWFYRSYIEVKTRVSQMAQLEMENHKWQKRFADLAQGIGQMAGELGAFEELKLNPGSRMAIQKMGHHAQFDGVGGSDSEEPPLDGSQIGTSGNLMLSMHRALDDINNKASALLHNRTALYTFVEKQNRLLAWVRPVFPRDGTIKLPIQTPDSTPLAVGGSPEEN
jgi:hypothetical protein